MQVNDSIRFNVRYFYDKKGASQLILTNWRKEDVVKMIDTTLNSRENDPIHLEDGATMTWTDASKFPLRIEIEIAEQLDLQCSGPGYAHAPHGRCMGYSTDRT